MATVVDFLRASAALFWREVIRFLRQRQRIVGALGTPLVFWLLLGSGMNMIKYFFPGTIVMVLLFTAIFSTISIIEDRREGFLQGVLVSPAPRASIVMGKIAGGTALATLQGLLLVACAPLVGVSLGLADFAFVLFSMVLVSFALTGLGFIIAWKLDSTQGFHAIMNLLLMPMWFLSGAFFSALNAPRWLQLFITYNPLTYGVGALHIGLFGDAGQLGIAAPSRLFCVGVMVLFAAASFLVSMAVARKND